MDSKVLGGGTSWKLQRCQLEATYSGPELSIGQSSSNQKNKEVVNYDMEWQEKDLGKAMDISEPEDYGMMDEDDCMYDDCMYDDYYDDDDGNDNDDEYEYEGMDSTSYDQFLAAKFDGMDLPPGVEATVPWLAPKEEPERPQPEMPVSYRPKNEIEHVIERKFKAFKQFDTVPDFPDHEFRNNSVGKKPSKECVKRVQEDWKILEKDLPDTIMVRACEDRIDLLRAAIVGPAGTPYHNGLFFFDIQFPSDYPHSPPKAHYHSGGLRLNPNLYQCGKVCLSLLGTWSGTGCEKWNSKTSTMLQVLVSIQALVLNEKPYFNEPGYAGSANTTSGERHFEDYVAGHFQEHGATILRACKAYSKGVMVGSKIPDEEEENEEKQQDEAEETGPTIQLPAPYGFTTSVNFKACLAKLYEDLLMEFTVKGADTDKFLAEKRRERQAASST
ncbi:putative ubiquitin-conjugating enzyme E2 38 [Carex littledalei]|uniref:Putative ubiquitin-conjugating enzyme E2 38 n=1 Tax=Carex littledalei TaxID=544730 RepID=A0A833V8J8_9POAL|nr:putative ubiquitin-conjugating enzyme E2 38 [Carex littledalei]